MTSMQSVYSLSAIVIGRILPNKLLYFCILDEAIEINDKNDIRKDGKQGNGFPNKAFEPSTHTASSPDESSYLMPNTPLRNDTSPSVDGGEQDRNAKDRKQESCL